MWNCNLEFIERTFGFKVLKFKIFINQLLRNFSSKFFGVISLFNFELSLKEKLPRFWSDSNFKTLLPIKFLKKRSQFLLMLTPVGSRWNICVFSPSLFSSLASLSFFYPNRAAKNHQLLLFFWERFFSMILKRHRQN